MTYTWIELRLRELKKKKKELGTALGLPPSRISDIIKGNRRIQSQEIPRLSAFLKMDTTTILKNIQEQSGEIEPEITSTTEQITVVGHKGEAGNNYNIWPIDQQYIITLPRQSSYGGLKKFVIQQNCAQSNTLKLYICIHEKPEEMSKLKALRQFIGTPPDKRHQLSNSTTIDDRLAFVIAYYEQY